MSAVSRFTPGPWKVVDRGMWDISVEAGGTVCHVNNKGEWFSSKGGESISGRSQNRMLADARLISAAPELLAELGRALDWIEDSISRSPPAYEQDSAPLVSGRAAIAKATGAQS